MITLLGYCMISHVKGYLVQKLISFVWRTNFMLNAKCYTMLYLINMSQDELKKKNDDLGRPKRLGQKLKGIARHITENA